MNSSNILQEIANNIEQVVKKSSPLGISLWEALLEVHPADIANFASDISSDEFVALFLEFPSEKQIAVFEELSEAMKLRCFLALIEHEKSESLHKLGVDHVSSLLDNLSDKELASYFNLLSKNRRDEVISRLKFEPDSAGEVMHTQVMTFMEDFTVEKCVKLMQRLRPSRDIHRYVYVTDRSNRLTGFIYLEDLVLHNAHEAVGSFMRENKLVAHAGEDQEDIAKKMVHYGVITVPVVDMDNQFLGVISGRTMADILVEEAREDAQKMAALAPIKNPYFETSFFKLVYERIYVLVPLLLFGSISTLIVQHYESMLSTLVLFLPMLTAAGGNASSQTSAVAIQGMVAGDINTSNMFRFLRREFMMALMIAVVLGATAFFRVYWTGGHFIQNMVVSVSLGLIVMTSIMLGSSMPLVLKRFNLDPALSAGPVLATIMDICGAIIYCYVAKSILL